MSLLSYESYWAAWISSVNGINHPPHDGIDNDGANDAQKSDQEQLLHFVKFFLFSNSCWPCLPSMFSTAHVETLFFGNFSETVFFHQHSIRYLIGTPRRTKFTWFVWCPVELTVFVVLGVSFYHLKSLEYGG